MDIAICILCRSAYTFSTERWTITDIYQRKCPNCSRPGFEVMVTEPLDKEDE